MVARNTIDMCGSYETCTYTNNSFFFGLQVQSEEIVESVGGGADAALSSAVLTSQNVTFTDNATGEEFSSPKVAPGVALVDGTEDLQLGNFFARPTLIDTTSWTTSTTGVVLTTLQPWSLLLSSTAIKKKLDNFAFLRGTLHLKTVVNGTPFQYGSVRMCYSPLEGFVDNKVRLNPITDSYYLIPFSQQPGYFMTPAANAGGEMTCPFIFHRNWLDVTSASEVQKMGTARIVMFYPLSLAVTGGTTAVTLQTYAWLTDLELMASTSKLALQGDEYIEGPISGPATAVANIAAQMTKVPIIGRFARATEIGAGALAQVARLFGYTNAPVIEDVKMFVPSNGPQLASAHIGTPVQKLTLDPKQELSIDPTPHGCSDQDELSMAFIKKKESYFGIGNWATSDAVGTLLMNFRVNPSQLAAAVQVNSLAQPVASRCYHTPLSYYGLLFNSWRGGLILRLRIVCTKFHKGRLIIQYDPRNDISTSQPAENTVYTHILDIGETDNLEIEIPYHQAVPWLDVDHAVTSGWSPSGALAPKPSNDNGLLTVRVLTALTAPSSGSIGIQGFVRGSDDFEFANPVDRIISRPSAIDTDVSFFDVQGADKVEISPNSVCFGSPARSNPNRYGMNYGECITSLRNIAHRYATVDTTTADNLASNSMNIFKKSLSIMPATPGYDPSASTTANKIVAASGTAPYTYRMMHHVPFIAAPFIGFRGGANYVFTPDAQLTSLISDVRVHRNTHTHNAQSTIVTQTAFANSDSASKRAMQMNVTELTQNGLSGMAITATNTNGSLSFNIPDYKRHNFSLMSPSKLLLGQGEDNTNIQGATVSMLLRTGPDTPIAGPSFHTQMGAGVDFTCLYFLCTPTLDHPLIHPTTA